MGRDKQEEEEWRSAVGGEPAWLERQVQRANREGMQRYEDADSHNCARIADLRLDFDPRRTFSRREQNGFPIAPSTPRFPENCISKLHRRNLGKLDWPRDRGSSGSNRSCALMRLWVCGYYFAAMDTRMVF